MRHRLSTPLARPVAAAVRLTAPLALLAAAGGGGAVALAAASPAVQTGSATRIADRSAVLNGRVNPNGTRTRYWFVWGLTPSYGSSSAHRDAGSGSSPASVRVTAGGLLPGTRYYYRLFAQNRYGLSVGSGRSFISSGHPLPGADTGAAAGVSTSSAVLTGTVVPNGQATAWEFQYGPAAGDYPYTATGGTLPAGTAPVPVAAKLTGLEAGTTFHYRLVARHAGFPASDGLDQAFTTLPRVRPYPRIRVGTIPHRAPRAPFTFTTLGVLAGPASFPQSAQCSGTVSVAYFSGRRRVALRRAPVEPNCTFGTQVSFTHTFASRPGRRRPRTQRLRVAVRFHGNGYLAPIGARVEHVVLG